MKLTQELLKKKLYYDPRTGLMIWLTGSRRGYYAGWIVNGYIYVRILGLAIGLHRLAWLYVNGALPDRVDHKNCDSFDNRIGNLRPATQSQNRQNARVSRWSKSGFKGVCWCAYHKKFRAMIGPRGKVRHLGYFTTAIDAHSAYVEAAKSMYGEFARAA